MDTQKFMDTLRKEAQAQLDFNRKEWPDNPGTAEEAVNTTLECASAELSMQDYAAMVDEVGAGKPGFVATVAATLK